MGGRGQYVCSLSETMSSTLGNGDMSLELAEGRDTRGKTLGTGP
jgi:hypothetical protein